MTPESLPESLDVLVVDDDDDVRIGLSNALRDLGHVCRAAKDGVEALEMLADAGADVVVSDWQMPRMDGLELCRRVREAESPAYTYFIFMTAFADRKRFLQAMHAGADDFVTTPIDIEELEARLGSARRVTSAYRRLSQTNDALRRDSQASFRLARIDPLTRVPNRLQMKEDLERVAIEAASGRRYCAGLCDIDFFKKLNDELGHAAGDRALAAVAGAIRAELRREDAVYRYGGEEFLVTLPDRNVGEACAAMERVRAAVERLGIACSAAAFGVVTISVGIAELAPFGGMSVDAWLERADHALYRAKDEGRDRICVHGESGTFVARSPSER
jgi:two-component system chemotaxis response regulator CheY